MRYSDPRPAATTWILCLGALLAPGADATVAPEVSYAEVQKLVGRGEFLEEFGTSVSIEGDTLMVGSRSDEDMEIDAGSVTVFERNAAGSWDEARRLLAPDGDAQDAFGIAVALSGDWLIVGANGDDDLGSGAGAAYVFERNTGGADNWGFVTKLLASDGDSGDSFGADLALCGDTAIIGALEDDDNGSRSGSAYVFQRDAGGAGNWGQVVKLTAVDGEASDRFGNGVDISGDWVVVGASEDDDAAPGAGAVYVFERDTGGADKWGLVKKVIAADGEFGDGLGTGVAIDGDTFVTGVGGDDEPGIDQGSAYVFQRDLGGPNNWGQVAKLTAADGAAGDLFGASEAIDGDTIVISAWLDNDRGFAAGSAYVFGRDEGGADAWGKIAKLLASDGGNYDNWGWDTAIDGGTIAISTTLDNAVAGAVYVFDEITVDPSLAVTGSCPGEVVFDFTGGTPLGQAALAFSPEQGSASIPGGLCGGTETGLEAPDLLGIVPIDQNGEVSLDATLPFFVCDLQLQAVDLVSCATSNVSGLP